MNEVLQQSFGPIWGRKERRTVTKQVLTAKDISEICGISESKSYQVIRQLNEELDKKGYLTFRGRVSRAFFYEKMYGMKEERGA